MSKFDKRAQDDTSWPKAGLTWLKMGARGYLGGSWGDLGTPQVKTPGGAGHCFFDPPCIKQGGGAPPRSYDSRGCWTLVFVPRGGHGGGEVAIASARYW